MPSRIPKGASWGLQGAFAIADDPARLAASVAFWRQALAGLNITDFATFAHPAVLLAKNLSDEWFFRLLPERERLVAGCDDSFLVKRCGPLVSLQELAKEVSPVLGVSAFLDCIAAFLTVGTSGAVVPRPAAALGIVAVRELFDLIRRFSMCTRNAKEFGLAGSELLALYRQEGALVVAPPCSSYRHGPLIHTCSGCPRDDTVSLFDETCARPGFNIVYSFLKYTDALRTDTSIRFDLLLRNLLVVAGTDIVLFPQLPARDELCQLWIMARSGPSPSQFAVRIRDDIRNKMAAMATLPSNVGAGRTQRQLVDELCIGLLRTYLENQRTPEPVEGLLNWVWLALNSLLGAHAFRPAKPWAGRDVWLCADLDGTDTYECLRTQVRWYASRKQVSTLLAWKDRSRDASPNLCLSPFMTYLRFHAGDAIFIGILLRIIDRFGYVLTAWERNKAVWGSALLDAMPTSGWVSADFADLHNGLRIHWATGRVAATTAWHHIGLIDALRQLPNPPSWMTTPTTPDPNLVECARISMQLVEAIARPGVLNAVSVALEYTPASWLANHGFTSAQGSAGASTLVKTHSFERLRLAYTEATHDAGIEWLFNGV